MPIGFPFRGLYYTIFHLALSWVTTGQNKTSEAIRKSSQDGYSFLHLPSLKRKHSHAEKQRPTCRLVSSLASLRHTAHIEVREQTLVAASAKQQTRGNLAYRLAKSHKTLD